MLLVSVNQAPEQIIIESNNTGTTTKVVSDIFEDDLKIETIGESLYVYGKTNLTKGEFEGLDGYTADIKVVDKNGGLIDEETDWPMAYFSGDVSFGVLDVVNAEPYKVFATVKDGTGKVVFTTEKIV